MKITTLLSIGVLAVSSAALAQMSTSPKHHKMSNSSMMSNGTMGNSDMSAMPMSNSMPMDNSMSGSTTTGNMSSPDETMTPATADSVSPPAGTADTQK